MSPNMPSASQDAWPSTGSAYKGSNIFGKDTNIINTSLSTMILVKVGNIAVGAIKSISISEGRTITMVDELGADGHIDSCPTKSTDVSGTIERIRFDGLRVAEAFGRGWIHIKSQVVPFNIEIYDQNFGKLSDNSVLVTVLENVWFEGLDYTYSSDDWIIRDSAKYKAETIYSHVNSQPPAQGGRRGIPLNYNTYELAADVGNRRGSMDVAGLLNTVFQVP